ncbi:hypothetical protein D3C79_659350 [compost metagenome]
MGGGEEGTAEIVGPGLDVIEVGVDRLQLVRKHPFVRHHAKHATIVIEGVEVEDLGVGEHILVGGEHLVGGRQYGDDRQASQGGEIIAIGIGSRIPVLAEDGRLDAAVVDESGQFLWRQHAGPLIEHLEQVRLFGGDELHVVPDAEVGVVEHQPQPRQRQAEECESHQPPAGQGAQQ